jgi:hypothetical protein
MWLQQVLLGALLCATSTANKCFFVAQGAYFNNIAEAAGDGGGTMVTLLNSLSNSGRFFPRPPAFCLVEVVGAGAAAMALALLGWAQRPAVGAWLQQLESVGADQWRLALPNRSERGAASVVFGRSTAVPVAAKDR